MELIINDSLRQNIVKYIKEYIDDSSNLYIILSFTSSDFNSKRSNLPNKTTEMQLAIRIDEPCINFTDGTIISSPSRLYYAASADDLGILSEVHPRIEINGRIYCYIDTLPMDELWNSLYVTITGENPYDSDIRYNCVSLVANLDTSGIAGTAVEKTIISSSNLANVNFDNSIIISQYSQENNIGAVIQNQFVTFNILLPMIGD